jgi:hypothetical protein
VSKDNEKAHKGTQAGTGNQNTDLGNLKRRRPAPMLTGDGMPGVPGQPSVHPTHPGHPGAINGLYPMHPKNEL